MKEQLSKPRKVEVKSGRLPYIHDSRTFDLADYLSQENLARVPTQHNWGNKIKPDKWGSLGNLKINNCTMASAGHLIMTWTSNIGKIHKPATKAIVEAYIKLTGYNPKTDGIGEPVEALKALKYWRKNGVDGRKISAFVKLAFKNKQELKQAVYLYGGCYIGINLPRSAEKQFYEGKKWTVPRGGAKGLGEPGSWSGHAMIITGYKNNELRAITWGREIIMSMGFWETYVDEAYAIFSEDFIKNDHTPSKINVEVLLIQIERLKKKAGDETI